MALDSKKSPDVIIKFAKLPFSKFPTLSFFNICAGTVVRAFKASDLLKPCSIALKMFVLKDLGDFKPCMVIAKGTSLFSNALKLAGL